MALRRYSVAAALAWALASAPAVSAEPYVVGSPVWDAAVAASTTHWGSIPCGGDVSYGWTALPGSVIGYATWLRSSRAPSDPSAFSQCHIDFDPNLDLGLDEFCTVLAHELGHLLGHDHAEDPASLMSPQLRDPLPECVTAMAPFRAPAPAADAPAAATAAPTVSRTTKKSKSRRKPAAVRRAKKGSGRLARHRRS